MFREQMDRGTDYIDYSLGAATEAHCEKQLPDMTLAKAELQEVPWSQPLVLEGAQGVQPPQGTATYLRGSSGCGWDLKLLQGLKLLGRS